MPAGPEIPCHAKPQPNQASEMPAWSMFPMWPGGHQAAICLAPAPRGAPRTPTSQSTKKPPKKWKEES